MTTRVHRRSRCSVCGRSASVRVNGTYGAHSEHSWSYRQCSNVGQPSGLPDVSATTPIESAPQGFAVGSWVRIRKPSDTDLRRTTLSWARAMDEYDGVIGQITEPGARQGRWRVGGPTALSSQPGGGFVYEEAWLTLVPGPSDRPFAPGDAVIVRKPAHTYEYPSWNSSMDRFDGTVQVLAHTGAEAIGDRPRCWSLRGESAYIFAESWLEHAPVASTAPAATPATPEDPAEKVKHELVAAARAKADEMGLCGDFDRVIRALGLETYGLPTQEKLRLTVDVAAPAGTRDALRSYDSGMLRSMLIDGLARTRGVDWELENVTVNARR